MANETVITNMIAEAQGRRQNELAQAENRFRQDLGVVIGASLVAALQLTPILNNDGNEVNAGAFTYLGQAFVIQRGTLVSSGVPQFYAKLQGMPQSIYLPDGDTLLLWLGEQVAL